LEEETTAKFCVRNKNLYVIGIQIAYFYFLLDAHKLCLV